MYPRLPDDSQPWRRNVSLHRLASQPVALLVPKSSLDNFKPSLQLLHKDGQVHAVNRRKYTIFVGMRQHRTVAGKFGSIARVRIRSAHQSCPTQKWSMCCIVGSLGHLHYRSQAVIAAMSERIRICIDSFVAGCRPSL